jgi:uncharacterized membrane protein
MAPDTRARRKPSGLEDDMFGSTSTILMLMAVVLLYMLPTLIAFGREHPRRQDVAVVNILLGWTLIGWIAVFLWASLARTEDGLA